MDAASTSLSNTPTGSTEGSSDGGIALEAHSKACMRLVTHETVRAPPSGHAIGISGSSGAAGDGGFESYEVEVEAVDKKSSSEEGGAGGAAAGGEESIA